MLGTCCRVLGVICVLIALGCSLVAATTVWTYGHLERVGGGSGSGSQVAAGDEDLYLTLWRRVVNHDVGQDEDDLWKDYLDRKGFDEQYCPEDSAKTYGEVFVRIQAAEACVVIAVIAGAVMLLFALLAAVGLCPICARVLIAVPAVFSIAAGAGAIIAWMSFYNMCSENFCKLYVNQLGTSEGRCGLSIGYGFMCASIFMTLVGLVLMCAAGPRIVGFK